ncbi:homocysteine S-methyltransferase [Shimia gijangensis]|uniref:Homocysteine S-methyltransferase n=1 Tax=Shimia gijangensis TaxID=1470563 RepID=A0A1M6Q189_9RHOB|nr:homocysteine S-methyltransferase family protein [Shimia gijangensis]SHK13846.1 homocysteine S-methyltransferase [Shimia gijangensis]
MTRYSKALPQLGGDLFLVYLGMETDLIFSQGVDLPGFASYPLLETKEGRAHLRRYFHDMIDLGRAKGAGVILESPTWVANRDRAAGIGYAPETLRARNIEAIELMASVREECPDLPTVLSASIGPRTDAYAPSDIMAADEAERYHSEQIEVLASTSTDMIGAYTLAYPEEAIGMVRAAQTFDLPIAVSFTVETDGCLPTGASLRDAIEATDQATDGYASYFLVNCAHPDHFTGILTQESWMRRLKGVVANASRCSHAELDEAEELDAGNPLELGRQLAEIYTHHPNITILGGCCGTDMRHMRAIAQAVRTP